MMQEKNINLKTPVRYFKGVGPKKSAYLAKLGIETALDLLYYLPAKYEDRSSIAAIRDLKEGAPATVQGEVITLSSRTTKSGMPFFQIAVTDGTGFIHAIWFNQPYLKDHFKRGQKVVLYGRVERYDKLQIVQPEYEIAEEGEKDSINVGRIVPIYPLTAEITQRYMRSLTHAALSDYGKALAEKLPTYIIARGRLVDVKFAIRNIHFPTTPDALDKAYRRIVFEEFFLLQLALALKKKGIKEAVAGIAHNVRGELIDTFRDSLPFELTAGQNKAIADIERDMSSTKPMNRLLEGDVGSGKTVVAAHALVLTVQNGFQGAIMAPTEVLARQHFIVLSELLMPLGINVVLLVSGIEGGAKSRIYTEIEEGRMNVVVGTHAVIQEDVRFKRLGLVVIDEQHKFGVTQRAVLREKGYNPHVLVMTATPIPRTLALTVYGDLDISVIREMPKGRKPIVTYWVEEAKRGSVYSFVKEELAKGRQAYVVCPLIEKTARSLELGARSLEETFDKLKNEIFTDFKVGLLHGKMSTKEKDAVMKDFKKGKTALLVSTIVIEVGIDVPNATVMLVENAERFGLAQLHQLRGRVGRGEHESYCILLADPKTERAAQRLKAVEGTLDGFEIAEADLDIRGPGEFFGTKQHGLPEIRFGNIIKDFDIMELARKEAFALVARDPGFREEHHRALAANLAERFKGKFELAKVG
ncbi:MAG: ATP-dependent DNA helicase RecG [Candidatus Omnitrophota bacterium]